MLASVLALGASTPASAQYGGPSTQQSPASGPPSLRLPRDPLAATTGRRGWTIAPMLAVEETYTDNLRLSPKGSERGDFVTSVRPSILATYVAPRAQLDLGYSPQLVYRANESSHDLYHYLTGRGNAELMENLLFIDGNASITQQNVSLEGPQAQSNINDTGNRTSVRTYSVSPYLRREFGYEAVAQLRYTRSTVEYSGNALQNSDADRIDAQVVSGPAYKLLTWNGNYRREVITYETGQEVEFQSASVGGRRLVTPTLGVLASVGYEENDYGFRTPGMTDPKGAFWHVGPEWMPSPRTRLAATAGHRYYGQTKSLRFNHRARLTSWRVDYREDVTTTRSQSTLPATADTASILDSLFLSSIPDPAARQAAVQNYIAQTGIPTTLTLPLNYITLVPFLEKVLSASAGVHGVRNNIVATAFSQTREPVGTPNIIGAAGLNVTAKTKQTGGGVTWTSRLSAVTTSTASIGYTVSEFVTTGREDKLTSIRVGITRQFQPRVSGSVTFRHLQNSSNQPTGSYRENAVTALLSIRF